MTIQTDIKPGDFVLVPAGSVIWQNAASYLSNYYIKESTRNRSLEVGSIRDHSSLWHEFLDPVANQALQRREEQQARAAFDKFRAEGGTGSFTYHTNQQDSERTRLKAEVLEKYKGLIFVYFTSGNATLLANVTKNDEKTKAVKEKAEVAKTAPPVEKENKAASKRSLMKPKTEWVVGDDLVLSSWFTHPDTDHNQATNLKRAIYNSGADKIAQRKRLIEVEKTHPSVMLTPYLKIAAGAVLTIAGKSQSASTWTAYDDITERDGLMFPVTIPAGQFELIPVRGSASSIQYHFRTNKHADGSVSILVPFKQIDAHIEPNGALKEQFIYAIFDKDSGKYYKTTNDRYFRYVGHKDYDVWSKARQDYAALYPRNTTLKGAEWLQHCDELSARMEEWEKKNPRPQAGHYEPRTSAEPFEMFDKVTKAKQHTDIGKVKMTILNFTAYYSGIDQSPDTPEWRDAGSAEDARPYPLLPGMVAHKIEKFSKKVVEEIDLQEWYARTLRLRVLTKTFGSSARSLYNKLEKDAKLGDFQYIVVAATEKEDRWGDLQEMTPGQVKEVDEIIDQLELKKEVTRTKDKFGMAIATPSFGAAVGLKLGIEAMSVAILDINNMTEVVEEQATA